MAERLFKLPETKGFFQVSGIVNGTEKDNFYKEIKTKTGKIMRISNFGVEYKDKSFLYMTLQGVEMDNVYFSKKSSNGEKSDIQKVPWVNRMSFNKDGYKLIGTNIGVKKKIDENGNTVNDKKILTDFDACKEVKDYLRDDVSVYVRGNIDYSSFIDKEDNKRVSVKLEPKQISLCKDVNFMSEDYQKKNDFNQMIIFISIEQEKNNNEKTTGRFVVLAKVVTYSSIEDVEFIIENKELANMFKKKLKPYNSIKVNGHIEVSEQVEIVDDDDNWGEEDSMSKITAPVKREFIITGAKGSSLDKETYTEENVTEAIAKINKAKKAESDYGDEDEWGDFSDDDEEESAW